MPSELPAVAPQPSQRLHPASILFGIGSAARRLLLPGILVLIASRGSDPEFWFMLLFLPASVAALARYACYRYSLGPEEIVIQEGIITRNERHVPYSRVQNIDLIQNPLHRLLQVAEVRLETAGGDKPEAVIRVLSLEAVEQMRAHVFAGRGSQAAAGAPPAARGDSALLRLSWRDVLLYGVISNRGMVVVAAALGLVWQFGVSKRWEGMLSRSTWDKLSFFRPPGGSTLALAMLFAVAVVAGFVLLRLLSVGLAFFRLHGFRLERYGEDLRAVHGLLTRVSKTFPRHRIQVVSVRETPLHRVFGRAAVQVETAGAVGDDARAAADRLELAPLIRAEKIDVLLEDVLPGFEWAGAEWQPIAPRAWVRMFNRSLILLLLIAAGAVAAFGAWGVLPSLALVPCAYVQARLQARHTGYAVVPAGVLYRSGFWVRRMSLVRFGKVQAVELKSSLFDRRAGMASLHVDTAGSGRIGHPIAIPFLEASVATQLLERVPAEASLTAFHW